MKKVVCFGGGNAIPKVVLSELKKYPVEITSVTSMVDNGGSTGQLRKDFDVLPPGDIRRHLLALSEAPEWKKELWNFRFGHEEFEGGHKGHKFSNIFIAGLEYNIKDYGKVLDIVHKFLNVRGRCLPTTIEKTQVIAILENSTKIIGEDEIDVPKKHSPNLKIKDVYLKPGVKAYPKVLEEIKEAGILIFGPGDIYSSIIPCFLPEGVKEAIQRAKAKKVFICPAMTKLGETQNFSVLDYTKEIEKYIGCELDFVIFNKSVPEKERIEKYKEEEPQLIEIVNFSEVPNTKKFIVKNLLVEEGPILHSPEKVVEELLRLCKQ